MEKTIRELCKRVASTRTLDKLTPEVIVQYQDLIGHASVEENRELSNTPELTETFYWIYGEAYGTIGAIKFYLENSNYVRNMKEKLEANELDIEDLKAINESIEKRAKYWEDIAVERKGQLEEAKRDMDGTMKRLEDSELVITALKAKIYDLMEEIADLQEQIKKEK